MHLLRSYGIFHEEECLDQLRAGGPRAEAATGRLYLAYRKKVLAEFVRLVKKYPAYKGECEDLVHEAFILLVHKIRYESVAIHNAYSYWVGIGRNMLLNQVKKDRRVILVMEPEEIYGYGDSSPEEHFIEQEEEEALLQVFGRLGARCRDILMLWYNRYSMHEIAQHMHLAGERAAKKVKYRCFKKLKELACGGANTYG